MGKKRSSKTVSSTIVFLGGGDFSRQRRDLSLHRPEKSRFLPLYYSYSRLVREARGNHCHTSLEHQAHPRRCRRRPPPPLSSRTAAVVSCRHPPASLSTYRRLLLLHGGGKACQYFWRPGSSSKEAFIWVYARLTRDDAFTSPIIGDAIATTERRRHNLRHLCPSAQRRQPPPPLRGGQRHVCRQSAAAMSRMRACDGPGRSTEGPRWRPGSG